MKLKSCADCPEIKTNAGSAQDLGDVAEKPEMAAIFEPAPVSTEVPVDAGVGRGDVAVGVYGPRGEDSDPAEN